LWSIMSSAFAGATLRIENDVVRGAGAADRIVAAAQRLFRRHGYRGTSMGDIAEEAGLAKATLYLHFNGKEAIFRSLIDGCRAEIERRAIAAEQSGEPLVVRLTSLLYAYVGTSLEWYGDVNYLRELHAIVARAPAVFGAIDEEDLDRRIVSMIEDAAKHGEIVLARTGPTPTTVAQVLRDSTRGAKTEGITPERFRTRLEAAATLAIAAIDVRRTD